MGGHRLGGVCGRTTELIAITDSPVARANRGLAVGSATGRHGPGGAGQGRRRSGSARSNAVASIRADLLRRAGRRDEARQWNRQAFDRAGSDPARNSCVATVE